MEDPRIRKFAQFLIRSAVGLEKGEKILIELHGSETGLMKSLVQEAYAVGGKPFVHIFDYAVEGALVQGADAEHMEEIASYELERMRDMDAYIDIRATTNISMWHNVSDEAQKRYRQYYWGPSIWRSGATIPSGPCSGTPTMPWPSWRAFPRKSMRTSISGPAWWTTTRWAGPCSPSRT